MELGQVLVVLLYLWLFASLGVYGWRAYRRIAHHETRADRIARRTGLEPEAEEGPGPDRPASARMGYFPPLVPGAGRPVVADLVTGIALPCDLVPVVDGDLDPHRAVFAATGHTPAEIGTALTGELERLGFAVRATGEAEVVAERSGSELRVRVHADGHRAHPAAPRHSVVAELTT
jgi:hypothetical protein